MAESARLSIFISYSTEDEVFATKIGEELRRAFNPAVLKIALAAEFSLGTAWREQIEDDLDSADVLIIIATGQQKLSHSFTGFEVGYFKNSRKNKKKMQHFNFDRLILPIPIFTKTPDPVADIQSLQIDGPLNPLTIDPSVLKDLDRFIQKIDFKAKKNPLIKLFTRIQSIIKSAIDFSAEELEAFDSEIVECSRRLHTTVFNELKNRVSTDTFPERKIVLRIPGNERRTSGDPLSNATIEFFGRSFEVFGFGTPPSEQLSWPAFLSTIEVQKVAMGWNDAILTLVTEARGGQFDDNRQSITSIDQNHGYRMFVGRRIQYLSGLDEIHIYIVEIKARKSGDPTTSMLLKAISVGLRYRFMFLEDASEFSPRQFHVTLVDDFRARVTRLVQELDFLLWESQSAGLGEPENILKIYGQTLAPGEVDAQSDAWEEVKSKLYAVAQEVIAADTKDAMVSKKAKFISVLEEFCAKTVVMNREFTAKVIAALQDIVSNPPRQVSLRRVV